MRRLLLGHLCVELGHVDADAARGDGLHLGGSVRLGHELVGPDRMLRAKKTDNVMGHTNGSNSPIRLLSRAKREVMVGCAGEEHGV